MKAPDDEHINKIINPVYCRGCGKSIHADAVSCPHCGAQQQLTTRAVSGSPALAIVSCVMGVLLIISILLADAAWDHDAFVGEPRSHCLHWFAEHSAFINKTPVNQPP